MANAFVCEAGFQPLDNGLMLIMQVIYTGADIGDMQVIEAGIPISGGESPVALRQAISSSVIEQAAQRGWSVAATNITMPSYQKG